MPTPSCRIQQWKVGLLSDTELLNALADHGIRGGIEDGELTAYDYSSQRWINEEVSE